LLLFVFLTLKGKEKQEGKKNHTLEQVPVGVSGKDVYCGRNVYILFPVLP
jgi:hypothetical protein